MAAIVFTPPTEWINLVSSAILEKSGESFVKGIGQVHKSEVFFTAKYIAVLTDVSRASKAVDSVVSGVRGNLTKALKKSGVSREELSDRSLYVEALCRICGAQAVRVACGGESSAIAHTKLFKGLVFAFEALQEVHMRDRSHYDLPAHGARGSKGTVGWDTVILITVVQQIQHVAQKVSVIEENVLGGLVRNWRKLFVFLQGADGDARKEIARRRGALPIMNALLIILFQHNNTHQCRVLLQNIEDREKQAEEDASKSILRPAAHLVSEVIKFRYYQGRMKLHEKTFNLAFDSFRTAYRLSPVFEKCNTPQLNNKRRIAFYWVVSGIAMGLMPPAEVLAGDQVVRSTFAPLITAMQAGNVEEYETALGNTGSLLRKRGVYMLLQQGKILCWLFLLQRTHAALADIGRDNSRIDLSTLVATAGHIRSTSASAENDGSFAGARWDAIDLGSDELSTKKMKMEVSSTYSEQDVMALWVARLISKGLVKGYLSYEHQCLVLSRNDPFPTLKER